MEQNRLDPCSICLQPQPINPFKLPCDHIFCFLCAKGAVLTTSRCPLCRHSVSIRIFNNPTLLNSAANVEIATFDENYHWYYEGIEGWWLYDSNTSIEIEQNYQNGKNSCEVLIAGSIYIIDFHRMIQYRKDLANAKIRRIKRDREENQINTHIKGVAGIRLTSPS
ncbi:splicing factor 3B subunit 3-like [Sarcoptes scabiei]|nr:splicing factor 3B subunit 3-like [Sarcoptes scabiei]